MRGRARDIWRVLAVVTGTCASAACGGWGGELDTAVHVRLQLPVDSTATLYVDSARNFLIGRPGRLTRVRPGSPPVALFSAGSAVPEIIGEMGGVLFVRQGDRVLRIDYGSGVAAVREDVGGSVFARDPRGRWIIQGAGSGAVFGHSPESLEPVWGWASLGKPTTGLAISAEGARIYQAVPGEVIVRDIQTGRTLGRLEIPAPVHDLAIGPAGRIYGIAGTGERATVLAIDMANGDPRVRWRRNLRELDLDGSATLRLSPARFRLVLFTPGQKGGLRVLDTETGESIGTLGPGPIDARFAPDGELFLLYRESIRVVD